MNFASWQWAVVAILGLLALGGAATALVALFRDRARGRVRCPKCWYDMSAATTLRCPECGHDARTPKRLLKTRRRWKLAILGFVMVLTAGAGAEQIRENGWITSTPSWVYIMVLPRLEVGPGLKE